MFDAYVNRSAFYKPHKKKNFYFKYRRIGDVYHFPGSVVRTPALGEDRIQER